MPSARDHRTPEDLKVRRVERLELPFLDLYSVFDLTAAATPYSFASSSS